jgi:hypothetical protein
LGRRLPSTRPHEAASWRAIALMLGVDTARRHDFKQWSEGKMPMLNPQRTPEQEASLPSFDQEEAMDVAKGGSWHFGFNMAGDISEELVRGREKLFMDHVMRREKVGLFDSNSVSDMYIEHYARALQRPGALRSSFSYYRTLPIDWSDNSVWGQTPYQCQSWRSGLSGDTERPPNT